MTFKELCDDAHRRLQWRPISRAEIEDAIREARRALHKREAREWPVPDPRAKDSPDAPAV